MLKYRLQVSCEWSHADERVVDSTHAAEGNRRVCYFLGHQQRSFCYYTIDQRVPNPPLALVLLCYILIQQWSRQIQYLIQCDRSSKMFSLILCINSWPLSLVKCAACISPFSSAIPIVKLISYIFKSLIPSLLQVTPFALHSNLTAVLCFLVIDLNL